MDVALQRDGVGLAKLDRKTLHNKALLPVCSVIIWQKCIRWSKGSWRRTFGTLARRSVEEHRGSRWRGQTGIMTCHPTLEIQGLDPSEREKEIIPIEDY